MFKGIYFLVSQIIFYYQHDFTFANPMFGKRVRLAKSGEFPYIVGISRINKTCTWQENFFCSGALITMRDVLTVAHCFNDESLDQVVVRAGSIDLLRATQYYPLWWVVYNDWAKSMNIELPRRSNDIAMLRLKTTVTHKMTPVRLTDLPNELFNKKEVVIAAFGQDKNGKVSKKMKTVKLNVLTIQECRVQVSTLHGSVININRIDICSKSDPPALMFYGDSGAPVLYENTVIAVHRATVPFPYDPFDMRKINIHTGINYYRNFIDTVIQPNYSWG